MTGSLVALDTSVAVDLLNGEPTISQWLAQFPTLCLPAPVLGELLFGAPNSNVRLRTSHVSSG